MELEKKFKDWFKNKDQRIMELHLKKDRKWLKKELHDSEADRDELKNSLLGTEELIEEADSRGSEEKISSLKADQRQMEYRLKKTDEIIAKTKVLLDDLNQEYCHELSGGHTLKTVAEALQKKFSPELKADYGRGREMIRKFLEDDYRLNKANSRELFLLLEDAGILTYRVEIPEDLKDKPLAYAMPEDGRVLADRYGKWEIRL